MMSLTQCDRHKSKVGRRVQIFTRQSCSTSCLAMKILTALCLVVFCVSFSEQKSRYINCPEDHNKVTDPEIRDGCYNVICLSEVYGGAQVHTCTEHICKEKQIGYEEDMSKTFPDCCGTPICG